jgi:hypothetical protein
MSSLQPVLVNSETTPTLTQSHEQNAVIINTSAVPDFSDVREPENVSTKFTDTQPVKDSVPLSRESNDTLKTLLNDLRTDFLAVVKLVDVLNRNVATYGEKIKNIEQNLNKLMSNTNQDDTSVAKIAELQKQIETLTKQNNSVVGTNASNTRVVPESKQNNSVVGTNAGNTRVVPESKQNLSSNTTSTNLTGINENKQTNPFVSSSKSARQKIDVKKRFSSNRY